MTLRPGWNFSGEKGKLERKSENELSSLGDDGFEGFSPSNRESIERKRGANDTEKKAVTAERRSTRQKKPVGYYQAG